MFFLWFCLSSTSSLYISGTRIWHDMYVYTRSALVELRNKHLLNWDYSKGMIDNGSCYICTFNQGMQTFKYVKLTYHLMLTIWSGRNNIQEACDSDNNSCNESQQQFLKHTYMISLFETIISRHLFEWSSFRNFQVETSICFPYVIHQSINNQIWRTHRF